MPSERLAEGEVTHIARQPLDCQRAVAQHAAYLQVLRAHGLHLSVLPELPEHPDGLFVEDVLVMLDGHALLTRPGAASRRGEVESAARAVRELGLPWSRIEAPATLDGGDVLVLPRHLLVGRSTRSNRAALAQLAPLAQGSGRELVSVAVHQALHLKSAVTALPDGSLIAVPSWVDTAELTSLGYVVRHACEASAGDVLCLGQTVVLPADAPRSAQELREHGFSVLSLEIDELQKLEGGLTCMCVLF